MTNDKKITLAQAIEYLNGHVGVKLMPATPQERAARPKVNLMYGGEGRMKSFDVDIRELTEDGLIKRFFYNTLEEYHLTDLDWFEVFFPETKTTTRYFITKGS